MLRIAISFALVGSLFSERTWSQTSSVQKAQVKVSLSPEMKEPGCSTIGDYIGEDENNYYLQRSKVKGVAIGMITAGLGARGILIMESHDKKTFLEKASQEFEPKVGGDKAEYDRVFMLNQKLISFVTLNDKKTDQYKLYHQLLDKKTMLPSGTPQSIMSIPAKSKTKEGYFDYELSVSRQYMAIIGSQYDEKDAYEHYHIKVVDVNLKEQWSKVIEVPYESKLFSEEGFYCDDQGNFYLLGRLYKTLKVEKRSGEPNYVYKLLAYRNKGTEKKEYTLTLKSNFITDLSFAVSSDDKIVCSGFYSEKASFTIKGAYYILIDAVTGDVIRENTRAFEDNFMDLFRSSEKAKKNTELQDLDLDRVILRSDGGALLLAEQYYVTSYTSSSYNPGTRTTTYTTHYTYHYNSIILVNVNPEGRIDWSIKIPKRQETSDDGGYYSSYSYAVVADKIYLVFNDNSKNLIETDPLKIAAFNGKNSLATLVTISSDGNWNKSYLFSNKEEGVILRPKVCEQMNPNQMFLYAEKGKDYIIGTVDF